MSFKSARFVVSSTDYQACPSPNKPEYAFIGRSNVGKSSLINMLTNHKGLAKTSAKPGKTQLINHFIIDNKWYLVDLPGYGWAQAGKKAKSKWQKMVKQYLKFRDNLVQVFVLLDLRHPPQTIDLEFLKWMGQEEIPLLIVLTKSDKVSNNKITHHKQLLLKALEKDWDPIPQIIVSSSVNRTGKKELSAHIKDTLNNLYGI